jgi:AbrB family looped-hinge helix DNA binding protein
MDLVARVTSNGRVTLPKALRQALVINAGDHVVFRVEGNHAILARTPDLLDLARSIAVPATKRNTAWDDVRHSTRSEAHRNVRRDLADADRLVMGAEAAAEWERINATPAQELPGLRRLARRSAPFAD